MNAYACVCAWLTHREMFVSVGSHTSIQTGRWIQGTGRGAAAQWGPSPLIISSYTATELMQTILGYHLQLSKGECEEVFQREGGWNPVPSAAVPCCPQRPGPTMWARDASAGQTRGETGERGGNTPKVFLHFPLWLGATCKWGLGRLPQTVLNNWELCFTQRQSGKDGSTCAED